MGKGSDYERERAVRWAARAEHVESSPALRLGHDEVARAIDPHASISEVLDRATGEGASKLEVIHDERTGATAVVVPVEQYLTLVTSHIAAHSLYAMTAEGRVGPGDATLTELGVEQVNPHDTWLPVPGYDPAQSNS